MTMPGYIYTGEDERTYEERSLVVVPGSLDVVEWDEAPDHRWELVDPAELAAAQAAEAQRKADEEAAAKAAAEASAEFADTTTPEA